jgi:serine/threonine protein kinase
MDLEKSCPKRHTHFKKGEQFPLTIGDTLGQGGYGAVCKAYSPLSGRTYALKTFRRTRKNAREAQSFMVELQILQRINHHHCVELVASYTDSRNFGLLMSPIADYNLSAFYEVAMNSEETRRALCTFFGCLANALRFLHDSKIRHRDIKPENILVRGPEVYLTDFGISLAGRILHVALLPRILRSPGLTTHRKSLTTRKGILHQTYGLWAACSSRCGRFSTVLQPRTFVS